MYDLNVKNHSPQQKVCLFTPSILPKTKEVAVVHRAPRGGWDEKLVELGPCRAVSTFGTPHSSTQPGNGLQSEGRFSWGGIGEKKVMGGGC